MIKKETIQDIYDAVKIDEVISEFVTIRKRGTNMIGLCPFHNEKTPSFTVSLTKGIYKCFGCGEGGNAVDFLMKHEHYNYPEALRWLAKKYNIVIEEEEESEEQKAQQDEKESLYTLNGFAAKFFAKQLSETDIGKSVALGYCRNRDINDASIKTFEIGYSPAVTDAFCQYALNNGYRKEQLIKGGLAIDRNGLLYDRFRDRLIFPIHNISGRIVGFGGRIFVNDPKKPKYLNSPESEIYNKSRVLYGLFHGRNAIVSKDNCLIVEGYTDVIALHQAGIKYVVSSSGTALSEEQIRIIKRFTSNITMIFDGDPAGIKASFRGIDMVLKQGMHVNIVPMPDGEDPDSFSKKYRSEEVENYLSSHAENFITFKANLLMTEAGDDPVKRAGVIKDILTSIAVIPELLERSLFLTKCSEITSMDEQKLNFELNKIIRKNQQNQQKSQQQTVQDELINDTLSLVSQEAQQKPGLTLSHDEFDIIRLLINYGNTIIIDNKESAENQQQDNTIANYIISQLENDNIVFEDERYQKILEIYKDALKNNTLPDHNVFIQHENRAIGKLVIELLSTPYTLSENWQKKQNVFVKLEEEFCLKAVNEALTSYRLKKVEIMYKEYSDKIAKTNNIDELSELLNTQKTLLFKRKALAAQLGRIVTH